jgi:hypothetical protein
MKVTFKERNFQGENIPAGWFGTNVTAGEMANELIYILLESLLSSRRQTDCEQLLGKRRFTLLQHPLTDRPGTSDASRPL